MPVLMNAADCLLVTSDAEGSPTVVQEALATNLPIVSVDTGDVAERLTGVRQTCIVPRNANMLGDALVELLRQNRRTDGRLQAENLSLKSTTLALMRLYGDATGAEARRWEPQEQTGTR
jgi:glycosyltransferase involved in cell wall biosynthesis